MSWTDEVSFGTGALLMLRLGFVPGNQQLVAGVTWVGLCTGGGLSSLHLRGAWELLLSSLQGDFPAVWKGLFFRVIVGREFNTDGSISLSLALLRCLFKCVCFAFQMVNVSVSNITVSKKKIKN